MATTEELLAQLENNPEMYASDESQELVIDAETRTINIPASETLFGVKGDKNIERKYFRCPRIVGDNIDLSTHLIYIAYVYTESNSGSIFPSIGIQPYHCDDVEIDGDNITFSWQLSDHVFQSAGFIAFKMYAKEKEDSPYTVFNTAPAIGTVLYTIDDGVESVVSEYPDIINQLLAGMESVQEIATPEAMQSYVDDYLAKNPPSGVEIDETLTEEGKAADAKKTGEELSKRIISPEEEGTEGQVLSKDIDGNNIWKDDELKDKSVTMNKTDFLSAKEAFNFIEQYRDIFNLWNYNTFPLLDTMPKDNVEFWVVTTENVQNDSGVQCVIYFEDYRTVNTVPVEKTQITVDDTTYYIRHWKFSYNHDVCKRWGFGNNVRLDTSQIVYWTDTPVDEEFLRNNGKTYSSNADFKKIVSDITNEQMEGIKKEVLDSANDEIAGMAIKINPIYGSLFFSSGCPPQEAKVGI